MLHLTFLLKTKKYKSASIEKKHKRIVEHCLLSSMQQPRYLYLKLFWRLNGLINKNTCISRNKNQSLFFHGLNPILKIKIFL